MTIDLCLGNSILLTIFPIILKQLCWHQQDGLLNNSLNHHLRGNMLMGRDYILHVRCPRLSQPGFTDTSWGGRNSGSTYRYSGYPPAEPLLPCAVILGPADVEVLFQKERMLDTDWPLRRNWVATQQWSHRSVCLECEGLQGSPVITRLEHGDIRVQVGLLLLTSERFGSSHQAKNQNQLTCLLTTKKILICYRKCWKTLLGKKH